MRRLVLRASKGAFVAAALFLLLPFAMPWVMWLPVDLLGPLAGFICVLFNTAIVYCLFGGLRTTSLGGPGNGR